MKSNHSSFFIILIVLLTSCKENEQLLYEDLILEKTSTNSRKVLQKNATAPLFRFFISGTGIDYIKSTDSNTFLSIEYKGQFRREISSKERFPLFDSNAYVFKDSFTGSKKIEIRCRSNFGSLERTTEYANMLTDKLGKLPVFMRDDLTHIGVIHEVGDAIAEQEGKFFFIFSERIGLRINANQLEETVFHKAVDVYFEKRYGLSEDWVSAQQTDGIYVTEYAKERSSVEDMPETAIFVYTMEKYPGRLSQDIEDWVSTNTNMPNRYAFLEPLFSLPTNDSVGSTDKNTNNNNRDSVNDLIS